MWDTVKYANVHLMGITGEEREKRAERIFGEIMAENLPNLIKDTDLHATEAPWTTWRIHAKRSITRNIIVKLSKDKQEGNLRMAREKWLVTYWILSKSTADISSEIVEARRKCWKKKNVNQDFHIWQNYPSKIEKLRHS